MTTLINVARYHLLDRLRLVLLPWGVLAFGFLMQLVIATIVADGADTPHVAGAFTLYIYMGIALPISVSMGLPFGLTLGMSRRSYYLGSIVLILGLGAVYSLGITALYALERVTNGWGHTMQYFGIPWLLDGAWYLTWLTSFVLLVLMPVYGLWFGLVYRRWSFTGLVAFVAAQVVVLLAAALLVTWAEAWPAVGEFFTTLTALGVTGVLAVLSTALALGGLSTIRRVTV